MPPKKSTAKTSDTVVDKSVTIEDPPAVETTVVETTVEVPVDQFSLILTKLQGYVNEFKELISTVKTLQKEHVKLQKATAKKGKKGGAAVEGAVKRSPSGFAKPTKLSDQLCQFLSVPNGSAMARTEVTRIINDYIKKNKLQNPEDKRQILPDDKLKKILNYKEGDKLSYFNLQTSLKHQFIKADVI
jgi:chromatin remodeling complex protein RSC6